jgi:hypothetical protein
MGMNVMLSHETGLASKCCSIPIYMCTADLHYSSSTQFLMQCLIHGYLPLQARKEHCSISSMPSICIPCGIQAVHDDQAARMSQMAMNTV